MKRFALTASILALALTSSMAGPVEDRKALMKANGKAAGALAPIVKGEKAFDHATVMAALQTINENAQKLDVAVHFRAGTETGDTAASPKIWEDMAGFAEKADAWKKAAADAVAANPQDVDALKVKFAALGQTCGGCHENFRLKKE